jgi:hypothetical protein
VYRRILGPVYDDEKENWRILTNKEIYSMVKKPTTAETIRPWFDLQLDALNSCLFTYNTFIKLLYMFRALTLLIIRRSTS